MRDFDLAMATEVFVALKRSESVSLATTEEV
jgi:hypothetical protein